MLVEALKKRYLTAGAALFPVALMLILVVSGRENFRLPWMKSNINIDPSGSDAIAQMREFLATERRQLGQFEREQATLRAEVIRQRKALQDGQLSKEQVKRTEQLFVAALKRVHEMRNTVTETDIAITETVLGEKVLRMPALPIGGFSQTAELTRFNGPFKWSIAEAPRVEKFFSQTFGRRLPITALGQSDIHTRLRFDHRDSMDIGLHPDSGRVGHWSVIYAMPAFPFSLFAALFQVLPLARIFISVARQDGSPASRPDSPSIDWPAAPPSTLSVLSNGNFGS